MHVIMSGPCKDLSRVRTVRHGSLTVEGQSLVFRANDGKQVQIALDSRDDVARLAAELLAEKQDARSSPD